MKILWIEDGGDPFAPKMAAMDLFQDLIPTDGFDDFKSHEFFYVEIPRIFETYSLHEIVVCRSYEEWLLLQETKGLDFDIALIDINLEKCRTEKPPIGISDFDRKAGLYIYHLMTRDHGFPDANIAFFTGQRGSFSEFAKALQDSVMPEPVNCYEKEGDDVKKIRRWLLERATSPYGILRRGILDGCRFARQEVEDMPDEELDARLPLFLPRNPRWLGDKDYYRAELDRYLSGLEGLLPLRAPKPQEYATYYLRFLRELTSPWSDRSEEGSVAAAGDAGALTSTGLFQRSSHTLLELLRDWSIRDLLSDNAADSDVAYVFLLAARAWVHPSFEKVERYEGLLAQLLSPTPMEEEALDRAIADRLEPVLRRSSDALAKEVGGPGARRLPPTDFLTLCRSYAQAADDASIELRASAREEVRTRSFELAYRAFWHGLAPVWIDPYSGKTYVSFKIEPLSRGSFLHFVGRHLFEQAFNDGARSHTATVGSAAARP